jgi:hypothetical protein
MTVGFGKCVKDLKTPWCCTRAWEEGLTVRSRGVTLELVTKTFQILQSREMGSEGGEHL